MVWGAWPIRADFGEMDSQLQGFSPTGAGWFTDA
jgi:hypothetical protein